MKILLLLCQLVSAGIMGMAGFSKLMGAPGSIMIFTDLGMEPFGRFLIGGIELLAAILLLSKNARVGGALLTISVMLGAVLAHITRLGFTPGDDGGKLVMMLGVVLLTSGYVLYKERRRLPIIGKTL